MRRKKKNRNTWHRKLRHAAVYYAARGVFDVVRGLPFESAQALGRGVGALAWAFDRRARAATLAHLRRAYGDALSPQERLRIARKSFDHLGCVAAEIAHIPRLTAGELRARVRVEGEEILKEAYARGAGRGVIALTAHLGAWEWIAQYGRLVMGLEVLAIAREASNLRIQDWMERIRSFHGVQVAYRKRAGVRVLRTLKRGNGVGILADQCTKGEGVFVPFFGHPAHTLIGPAQMAIATGASVVPMFMYREPDFSHYTFEIQPPIPIPDGPTPLLRACQLTAQLTAAIEAAIRKRPEQWAWLHRRWMRTPETDEDPVFDPATGHLRPGTRPSPNSPT